MAFNIKEMVILELYLASIVVPVVGLTIVAFLMICDVLSGLFKSIAQKRGVNSTIGINGLIRKAGVLLALLVFIVIDSFISLNFAAMVPNELLAAFNLENAQVGLSHVMLVFFGLFELTSLFENLGEIGVPIPSFIIKFVEKLKNTIDTEEK